MDYIEHAISTRSVFGRNIPVSGGAHFRVYPYALTRSNIRACEHEDLPVVFYIHPWEMAPEHPFVALFSPSVATPYANLRSTAGKLERLLSDFRFTPLKEALGEFLCEAVASSFVPRQVLAKGRQVLAQGRRLPVIWTSSQLLRGAASWAAPCKSTHVTRGGDGQRCPSARRQRPLPQRILPVNFLLASD